MYSVSSSLHVLSLSMYSISPSLRQSMYSVFFTQFMYSVSLSLRESMYSILVLSLSVYMYSVCFRLCTQSPSVSLYTQSQFMYSVTQSPQVSIYSISKYSISLSFCVLRLSQSLCTQSPSISMYSVCLSLCTQSLYSLSLSLYVPVSL